MLAESLLLLVFLLVGYAVQLAGAPARLRDVVWILFFWTFSPVLVFVTFLTVDLDEGLGRALGAAIVASWLVGLGGYGYARFLARACAARRRRRRPRHATAADLVGAVIGPYGFFLLGLSLTFARAARPPEELRRAAGAVAIRLAGGPLALLATAALLGADVPGVFYLLAGMPSAFHLLVLARVYEVRPALMNRIVVGTTIPAVAVVVLAVGLFR